MLFCAKLHYNVYAPRNKLTVITQRYIAKDIRLYFSVVKFLIHSTFIMREWKMKLSLVLNMKCEMLLCAFEDDVNSENYWLLYDII